MSRKVSFQCGFSDPTTTLDFAEGLCEPVTRVVTNGSDLPNVRTFFRPCPRTRVTSSTAPASLRETPGFSFLFLMGTLTNLGQTIALDRPLPMTSVTASLTPGIISMSPPTRDSAKSTRGWSTNANFIRWKHGSLSSNDDNTTRSGPSSCSSCSLTCNVRPMTTTSSTTVGSPHQRTSKSRITSSTPAPRTPPPVPKVFACALRTESRFRDSFPRLNSRNDIEMPIGVILARIFPIAPPIFSDSAVDKCGHSCASAAFSQTFVSWPGRLHHSGKSATMPRKPPAETMASTSVWLSRYGVKRRRSFNCLRFKRPRSVPRPCGGERVRVESQFRLSTWFVAGRGSRTRKPAWFDRVYRKMADLGTGRAARRGARRVLAFWKCRGGAHQLVSDSEQGQSTQPIEHILRFATRGGG